MKLVLFSGDHPRHLFVNQEMLKYFADVLVIVMHREKVLPLRQTAHDKSLFQWHFNNRYLRKCRFWRVERI